MHRWNTFAFLSAVGACCSLAVWISSTNAKEETSVLVKKPDTAATQGPVLPPPAKPATPSTDLFAPGQPSTPAGAAPSTPLPPPPQSRTNSAVKRPFMQPALPRDSGRGQLSAQTEPMPIPQGAPQAEPLSRPDQPMLLGPPVRDPNVRPTPRIKYDTDHDARKMYRSGQIQLVVAVQNPA